jgi:YidC/Oxa1 family membrane protein insertase
MKLYNKAGVNPMAGCIPCDSNAFWWLRFSFPSAFELRHKKFSLGRWPFFFWWNCKIAFYIPFMEIILVCFLFFLQR